MKPTLLLSDLHLPPAPSALREGFRRWLRGPAGEAERVYLLGDVFEYWIGDDVGLPTYAAEIDALCRLVSRGTAVSLIHGNRDFLLGAEFALRTGVSLLPDPMVVTLGGHPTLLSHGDRYCSGDRTYQRWRRFSRNPWAQRLFLALPRSRRERIASGLRDQSAASQRNRPEAILDVSPESIEAAFRDSGVDRMIHGHTHRPAIHSLEIDGRPCQRVVLPDWRPNAPRMGYLQVQASGEILNKEL